MSIGQKLLFEGAHRGGKGGGEEADLSAGQAVADERFEHHLELGAQELVRFIHNDDAAFGQVSNLLFGQIVDAAGGAHDDVHGAVKAHDVVAQVRATSGHDDFDGEVLGNLLDNGRSLQRKLARWDQHEHFVDEREGGERARVSEEPREGGKEN